MVDKLQTERIRGEEAKQLLENKIFREAIEAAEKSVLDQMDQVSMRDTEMHTRLILARRTVQAIRKYIEKAVQDGKYAVLELNAREKRKTREKT